MKTGVVRFNSQLLLELLGFPPGVDIVDARIAFERPDVIELRMVGEGLPDVGAGEVIPWVEAVFKGKKFVRFER